MKCAVAYACDIKAFENAFILCSHVTEPDILKETHLKHAMYLEDEGHFKEAELEFIKAEKPKEAIEMYIHNEDWDAAMGIAEKYDPTSIPEIYCRQAEKAIELKKYSLAESLYICANHPELVLKMYKVNI